jgi:ABC-2 type transport system permease protein
MASSFMTPILWLVIMGSGLSSSLNFAPQGSGSFEIDYVNFLFPGILAMNILFSSVFSALSIVYDREFGFFKEIFVAPISRTSIILGKVLGGATTATLQASLMFVLAPFVGVDITLGVMVALIPIMFLIAFGTSALGVLISARMKSTETFPIAMQFIMMPMFFLSGALFPLREAPTWLSTVSIFDPLTYGVYLLRRIFFSGVGLPSDFDAYYSSVGAMELTVFGSLFFLVGFALLFVSLSVFIYRRME